MAYLLIAGCVAVLVGCLWMADRERRSLQRMLERQRQAHEAREKELLDRVMYMADRPWTLPDAAMSGPELPPGPVLVWPEQDTEDEDY